jgi:hypothetical protein
MGILTQVMKSIESEPYSRTKYQVAARKILPTNLRLLASFWLIEGRDLGTLTKEQANGSRLLGKEVDKLANNISKKDVPPYSAS